MKRNRCIQLGLMAALCAPLVGQASTPVHQNSIRFSARGAAAQQNPGTKAAPARGKSEPAKPPRKRMVVDLAGFETLDAEKLKLVRTQVGATRGAAKPVALAPYRARLFGIAPRFAWSYRGSETHFKLLVRDVEGIVIYRAQLTGTEYAYPAVVPPLEPGKAYSWTVEVSPTPRAPEPSEPVEIVTLDAKERADIEKALKRLGTKRDYKTRLARAKLFTDRRLWYDAISEYCALIAQFSGRAELYEQRGMIYAQIDATRVLADADFARADELHSGPRPGN